jgi:purine-cytosine permease-like protein
VFNRLAARSDASVVLTQRTKYASVVLPSGALPLWAFCILTGVAVTIIVVYGFLSMTYTAYITVPLFLLLSAIGIRNALAHHALADLVSMPPPGEPMSIATGGRRADRGLRA